MCGSNRVRGEMRGGWPRSFIKKLSGRGTRGRWKGWSDENRWRSARSFIGEERGLIGPSRVLVVLGHVRRRRKETGRKEGIGERTCGRHVSWKRTARMMNLSRERPRCTTLAGLLFAHRLLFLENIFHRLFVLREWRNRADLPSKFPFSSAVVNTELRHHVLLESSFREEVCWMPLWNLVTNRKRSSLSLS